MSENPIEFFTYILEPISSFFSNIMVILATSSTHLLQVLASFWQGLADFLQTVIKVINGG